MKNHESLSECTDLELMRFVETAQRETQPNRWGWRIVDATAPHRPVIDERPGDNDGLRGQHESQNEALKAGVRYIKAKHRPITALCRDEAIQGIRYRKARQ